LVSRPFGLVLTTVQCDNQRPVCKKCVDTGRECGGYERERVFIVGTADDRGRCSSHPHRSLLTPKARKFRSTELKKERSPSVVQVEHEVDTSWVRISDAPLNHIQCLAVHTKLSNLEPVFQPARQSFSMPSLPHYPPDLTQSSPDSEFCLRALCLINDGNNADVSTQSNLSGSSRAHEKSRTVAASDISRKGSPARVSTCLFLYDVEPLSFGSDFSIKTDSTHDLLSTSSDGEGVLWKKVLGGNVQQMKQSGPASYQAFPGHHFFVRIFRNHAVSSLRYSTWSTLLMVGNSATMPCPGGKKPS
jgi:hypothetical protein